MFKNKNITLPNLLTLMSATCGLLGLMFISQKAFTLAILILVFSDVFDNLDGYIAKKFKMYSPIGQDLDTLVDAIVFLVPPYFFLLQYESFLLTFSSLLLVFSGLYRLARYNVEPSIPGKVKGLIASQPSHYIYLAILLGANASLLTAICLVSTVLMVLPFYSPAKYTNWASQLMIAVNLSLALFQL